MEQVSGNHGSRPDSRQEGTLRLHLGCGTHIVPGWVNIDGSWNARLAAHPLLRRMVAGLGLIPRERGDVPWNSSVVCHNVTKPLPFGEGSANCIYCSHMLEHLYQEEAQALLRECHRVLAREGILRMIVPDLHAFVRRYIESKNSPPAVRQVPLCAADQLNVDLGFRETGRTRGTLAYRLYVNLMDFHTHKWMYDAESLGRLFLEAGFSEVAEHEAFQSRIQGIEAIEQAGRTLDGQGVCIEGMKK
jgi:hypothetical protein